MSQLEYLRDKLVKEAQSWVDKLGVGGLKNKISDGYHTFGELYEHRIALFIALCRAIEGTENDAWKMPPKDGWFLMGIGKEKGKQITYHCQSPGAT